MAMELSESTFSYPFTQQHKIGKFAGKRNKHWPEQQAYPLTSVLDCLCDNIGSSILSNSF